MLKITDDRGNVLTPVGAGDGTGVDPAGAYVVELAGLSPDATSVTFTPVSYTHLVFDRFGPRGIGIAGLALFTGALAALSQVNVGTSVLVVTVLCALQASGQALANMPLNTWGCLLYTSRCV